MPKPRPTIVSFWVLRPEEHPEAEERNYPGMLRVLQRSCDRIGMRHIVLTDDATVASPQWPVGLEHWTSIGTPMPLMQAATELQARYLESEPATDTLFVGADCIFVNDPVRFYPLEPGLCVTYRSPSSKFPINTGAQMIRRRALPAAAALFRRVADRCGTTWCDDQRALIGELDPMPRTVGVYNRAGLKVAFLPMRRFNVVPSHVGDACRSACMLHFRGKARKQFFFDWARRHQFA